MALACGCAVAIYETVLCCCSDEVKAMFYHAYNSYMTYAYPEDELMPLQCKVAQGRVMPACCELTCSPAGTRQGQSTRHAG